MIIQTYAVFFYSIYIYRAVKAGNRCSPLLQELWSVLVFSIWNWDDLATYTVGCVPLKSTTLRSCSLRSATCIPKSMMFFFRSATGGCGMLLTGNLFRFIHARFLARIVPDCLFFWQFVRHLDALFEAGYFGGHMCIEPSMAYRGGSGPPVHHQSRQSLHHPHWALPPNPSLKLGSCWWESVLGPDIYGSQYMLRWLVPPANSNSCN